MHSVGFSYLISQFSFSFICWSLQDMPIYRNHCLKEKLVFKLLQRPTLRMCFWQEWFGQKVDMGILWGKTLWVEDRLDWQLSTIYVTLLRVGGGGKFAKCHIGGQSQCFLTTRFLKSTIEFSPMSFIYYCIWT